MDFVKVNVTIAVFNLLPCYPLDGARIIIGLVKNKLKALSFLRAAGIFISVILMALCLASAFFKVNYTFGIASIMLAYGAVGGTEKERYVHIYKELFFLKDLARPLEKSELFVCADVTLNALLKTLRSSKIYRINVVDGNMKTLFSLDNADLERLYMTCDRRLPLSQLSIFRNGKAASKETA